MRILLADHHRQAIKAITTVLREDPEIELIGEATDAEMLVKLARNNPVDLILIDRELPGIPIGNLITSLHALEPRPIVIVMSREFEFGRVMLRAGADAFVSKGEPEWLIEKLNQYVNRIDEKGVH